MFKEMAPPVVDALKQYYALALKQKKEKKKAIADLALKQKGERDRLIRKLQVDYTWLRVRLRLRVEAS